jgi:molybdopterin converting factor small subunit
MPALRKAVPQQIPAAQNIFGAMQALRFTQIRGLDIRSRRGDGQLKMMNVKVLFFGAAAEAAGIREVEISFDRPVNAGEAFAVILEKFPRLNGHKLLFARNQEYIKADVMIAEGDELAVFTAVSGG